MDKLLNLLSLLKGKKTYLAAGGLFCLAIYYASIGDLPGAIQTALAAAATAGLRNAIPGQTPAPPAPTTPPSVSGK